MTALDTAAVARALRAAADALDPAPAGPRRPAPRHNDAGRAAAVETHRPQPDPNVPAENPPASPPSVAVTPERGTPGGGGAGRGSRRSTDPSGAPVTFSAGGVMYRDGMPLVDALARYLDDTNTTAESRLAIALRDVLITCAEHQGYERYAEDSRGELPDGSDYQATRSWFLRHGRTLGMVEALNRVIRAALENLDPADMPESAEDAGWRAGVRWAAAEADARGEAHVTVPMADLVDITDHLRLCASFPTRATLVERWEAPEVRP